MWLGLWTVQCQPFCDRLPVVPIDLQVVNQFAQVGQALLGEFEADLDHRQTAMKHFRKALELATMKSEQIFLTKKIQELNDTDAN